jgi:hypothetical protein
MTYKYFFEKFKKNVFLINYYEKKEIIKRYLIKFSYFQNNESDICKEFYNNNIVINTEYNNLFKKIIYYKIFKNFNITDNLLIEIDNNDNKLKFVINLDYLIFENIIKFDNIKVFLDSNNKKISEFIILVSEYDESDIILSQELISLNLFQLKFNIIEKTLDLLYIIHNDLNMIHGDLKGNNILYNNNNIYFIDLEFSIFLKDVELRTVKEIDLINNYLAIDDNNYIISCIFLKFFDIYLFTLSFFINNKIDENHYLKHIIEKEIIKNIIKNKCFSNYIVLFYIIFNYIYNYFSKKKIYSYNDNTIFYEMCYYININYIFSLNNITFENYDIINYNLEYIYNIFNDLYNINNINSSRYSKDNINNLKYSLSNPILCNDSYSNKNNDEYYSKYNDID